MAHPPPMFPSKRSPKCVDQLHEKNNHPSLHTPTHPPIPNAPAPSLLNNPMVNKPANHKTDQNSISLKSNTSHERKCEVYVHHFSKIPTRTTSYVQNNWQSGNEVHQTTYKHEFSDYYDAKIHTLRRQFDNLSLNSRNKQQTYSPGRIPKAHSTVQNERTNLYNKPSKIPQIKSNSTSKGINKSFLFKPEHKAAVDKLEESYWAKWKPNKAPASNESHPKLKGLYTENEKVENTQRNTINRSRKERGDSNETVREATPLAEKTETEPPSTNNLCYVVSEPSEIQPNEPEEQSLVNSEIEVPSIDDNKDLIATTGTVIEIAPVAPESDSECNINVLKHTDSFILTAKKQNQEKPHFQQPKCIKLFKNAGYSPTAATTYVKGGSYPLKSCLKKRTSLKPSNLGRPGSPIRGSNTRRPGKANRFT